jgi:hypothetical protein
VVANARHANAKLRRRWFAPPRASTPDPSSSWDFTTTPPEDSLLTRNEVTDGQTVSFRMTLCAARRSHLYRAKFIPKLFSDGEQLLRRFQQ